MNYLPYIPLVGDLKLIEIYEFYDFPRFFSCRSTTGQIYFALSVAEDRVKYEWLFVPVSPERFVRARAGDIDIRTIFAMSEGNSLIHIATDADGKLVEAPDVISSESVSTKWLPDPGVFLSVDVEKPALIDVLQESSRKAIAARREVLRIALNFPNRRLLEGPARDVGATMVRLQELFNALGQYAYGAPTLRGAIPETILEKTRLNVSGLFASSFGIEFVTEQGDLFQDSTFELAAKELVQLIEIRGDADQLSNKLHELKGRVANKYKSFLEVVDQSSSGLKIWWASPDGRSLGAQFSSSDVAATLAEVAKIATDMTEEVQIRCTLVGLNVRTKTYEIFSLGDQVRYAGKILDEAIPEAAHATISDKYVARLKQLVEVQSATGDERTKWLLAGLRPIED